MRSDRHGREPSQRCVCHTHVIWTLHYVLCVLCMLASCKLASATYQFRSQGPTRTRQPCMDAPISTQYAHERNPDFLLHLHGPAGWTVHMKFGFGPIRLFKDLSGMLGQQSVIRALKVRAAAILTASMQQRFTVRKTSVSLTNASLQRHQCLTSLICPCLLVPCCDGPRRYLYSMRSVWPLQK